MSIDFRIEALRQRWLYMCCCWRFEPHWHENQSQIVLRKFSFKTCCPGNNLHLHQTKHFNDFFLQDSDLVLSVGGCRRKVSECPKTLFERNLDDVLSATMHCIEFNPKVVFCVAKPPIEAFVPLISEVSHHLSTIIITKLITIHGIIHYYLFPT